MAYTDLTTLHDPQAGAYPPATWGDAVATNDAYFYAQSLGSEAAWTSYTPTWSGTIGNGTITGRYRKLGRLVHFYVRVVWGGTTSHAAATQTLTLPFTAATPGSGFIGPIGVTGQRDISAGANSCRWLTLTDTTHATAVDSAGIAITNTVPFTWADTDEWFISGTYEATS